MLNATQGFTYNKWEKPNDWPKIKDTFDYQYDESGHLVGGNEHLYLSGPNTYEVVGNPIIKDNVASGLDEGYLTIANFPYTQNWEIVINANLNYAPTLQRLITRASFYLRASYSNWQISTDGSTFSRIGNDGYARLYPFIKLIKTNNSISAYLSSDGINYILALENLDAGSSSDGTLNISSSSYSWQGSIDLNNTYIKVNGKLWFYGKNYTTKYMTPVPKGLEYNGTTTPKIGWVYTNNELVKGPVNYNVVGSPTISNAVIESVDSSNYVTLSSVFSPGENDFEMVFKVKAPSTTGYHSVFGYGVGLVSYIINNISQSEGIRWKVNANADANFIVQLIPAASTLNNNWWYIRASRTAGTTQKYTYSIAVSSDKNTWQTASLDSDIEMPTYTNLPRLLSSQSRIGNAGAFLDLSETYIKINGVPWFGSVSKFQEFIEAPEGTTLSKDDTHSLTVETPTINGQVDYTVVGSPTITDGVVSGFSNSDYLRLNTGLPTIDETTDLEVMIKATMPSEFVENIIFGDRATNFDVQLKLDVQKRLFGYIYDNTTGSRIYQLMWATALNAGETYWLKYTISHGMMTIGFSSTGVTWTEASLQLPDGFAYTKASIPILKFNGGSIDLNETYIKVNGQYWFKPTTTVLDTKLVGPVDYTVIGSPTIVDGIASGFNSNNYLSFNPITITPTTQAEVCVKIKTPASAPSVGGLISAISPNNFGLYWNPSWRLYWYCAGVGDIYSYNASYVFASWDTEYKIKCTYNSDGTTVATVYNSSGTIIAQKTQTRAFDITFSTIGRPSSDERIMQNVDLNQTYIKVNGALWFGKETWNPSTHTDNAIYLLSGHSSDYSNYKELQFTPEINTESDEIGTYDVWIDNQKIYSNEQSGLQINWSKLALTTGYDITTPSTLKAHVIKIEPTDSNNTITKYQSNALWKQENGELVWADPRLALSGAVNYSVVGSPTITDGLASGFTTSNYLTLPIIDLSQPFEIMLKIRTPETWGSDWDALWSSIETTGFSIAKRGSTRGLAYYVPDESGTSRTQVNGASTMLANTDYYIRTCFTGTELIIDRSTDKENWVVEYQMARTVGAFSSAYSIGLNARQQAQPWTGSIDLNQTYIKVNNQLWFYGKNYATQNIAPVPAGYTFGNTTTPGIGYVDMRTQAFTAAPDGVELIYEV